MTQPGGVSDSLPSVTSFTYNFGSNTRVVSEPTGTGHSPTTYTLDSYGATTMIQSPEGQTTTMVWDFDHPDPSAVPTADHNGRDVVMLSKTDALGQTTSYKYDALGNVISQTVSSFPVANYAPVTQADGTGAVTSVTASYTYDPLFDRMTSETDANGVSLYFVYDSPEETLPPGVSVAINDTDPTGNLLASVDGMGFVTYYTYASSTTYDGTFGPGDLTSITDPNGNVTEYLSYDAYGDPTSIKNAVGDMTTDNYNARGLLLHETATGGVDVTKTYDALDRPTSIVQADDLDHSPSASLVDTYYPGGQVKTQTTGVGQVTTYDYDSGNRLVTMTEMTVVQADGSQHDLTTYYTYDAAGNMVRELDPRKILTTYIYDGLNRIVDTMVMGGPAPSPNAILVSHTTYDVGNNLLSDTDLHGDTATYTYDGLYRLVATTLPVPGGNGSNAVEQMVYDLAGNPLSESDANGNATPYTYDNDYRVKTMTDPMGIETTYTYDDNGNVLTTTNSSTGLVVTYGTYDGLDRPSTMTEAVRQGGPGSPVDTYITSYSYLDSENKVTITDPDQEVTVDMSDGLGRLTSQIVGSGPR